MSIGWLLTCSTGEQSVTCILLLLYSLVSHLQIIFPQNASHWEWHQAGLQGCSSPAKAEHAEVQKRGKYVAIKNLTGSEWACILISSLMSRRLCVCQVDLMRSFTFRNSKGSYSGIPIIAANMDTVGTFEMALALHQVGYASHVTSIDNLLQSPAWALSLCRYCVIIYLVVGRGNVEWNVGSEQYDIY